jgi:hypothetical protein
MKPKPLSHTLQAADTFSDSVYDKTTPILARYGTKRAGDIVPGDTLTGTLQIIATQFSNVATDISNTFNISFSDGDVGSSNTVSDLVTSICHVILKTRPQAKVVVPSKRVKPKSPAAGGKKGPAKKSRGEVKPANRTRQR